MLKSEAGNLRGGNSSSSFAIQICEALEVPLELTRMLYAGKDENRRHTDSMRTEHLVGFF